jgi:hypothetical protein
VLLTRVRFRRDLRVRHDSALSESNAGTALSPSPEPCKK